MSKVRDAVERAHDELRWREVFVAGGGLCSQVGMDPEDLRVILDALERRTEALAALRLAPHSQAARLEAESALQDPDQ